MKELNWTKLLELPANKSLNISENQADLDEEDDKLQKCLTATSDDGSFFFYYKKKLFYYNIRTLKQQNKKISPKEIYLQDINFEVHSILLNATATILSLIGKKRIVLIQLKIQKHINIEKAASCISAQLGGGLYNDKNQIIKVLWHPYSKIHLMILSTDSVLRMFNISQAAYFTTPEKSFDFMVTERKFSGSFEKVVSFCFGIDDGLWGLCTVYILKENGDVLTILPVLPEKWWMKKQIILNLYNYTLCNAPCERDTHLSSHYYWTKKFVIELMKQCPNSNKTELSLLNEEGDEDLVELVFPFYNLLQNLKPFLQGPFFIKPDSNYNFCHDILMVGNEIPICLISDVKCGITVGWIDTPVPVWSLKDELMELSVKPTLYIHEYIKLPSNFEEDIYDVKIDFLTDPSDANKCNTVFCKFSEMGFFKVDVKNFMEYLDKSNDASSFNTTDFLESDISWILNTSSSEPGEFTTIKGLSIIDDVFLGRLAFILTPFDIIAIPLELEGASSKYSGIGEALKSKFLDSNMEDDVTDYKSEYLKENFQFNSSELKLTRVANLGNEIYPHFITEKSLRYFKERYDELMDFIKKFPLTITEKFEPRRMQQKLELEFQLNLQKEIKDKSEKIQKLKESNLKNIFKLLQRHQQSLKKADNLLNILFDLAVPNLNEAEISWSKELKLCETQVSKYSATIGELERQKNTLPLNNKKFTVPAVNKEILQKIYLSLSQERLAIKNCFEKFQKLERLVDVKYYE
ncbi:hypothetical protein HDU92_006150 [Lobulomyces angularis]|nr:hypothetical protein HDU92_006150 [Lobulomyces angularis]